MFQSETRRTLKLLQYESPSCRRENFFQSKKISPREVSSPLLFNISHQPCAIDDRIKGGYKKPRLRESVGSPMLDGPSILTRRTNFSRIKGTELSYLFLSSSDFYMNEHVRARSRLICDRNRFVLN